MNYNLFCCFPRSRHLPFPMFVSYRAAVNNEVGNYDKTRTEKTILMI